MATKPSSVRWSEFTQRGMRCASQMSVLFSTTAKKLSCLRSASRNFSLGINEVSGTDHRSLWSVSSLDHLRMRKEEMIEVIVHQQHAEHHYEIALIGSQRRYRAHGQGQ